MSVWLCTLSWIQSVYTVLLSVQHILSQCTSLWVYAQLHYILYCTNEFCKGLKIQWTEIQWTKSLQNSTLKHKSQNIYIISLWYKIEKMNNWKKCLLFRHVILKNAFLKWGIKMKMGLFTFYYCFNFDFLEFTFCPYKFYLELLNLAF